MSTIPTLNERDIRSFVGEQNLLNGKKYFAKEPSLMHASTI